MTVRSADGAFRKRRQSHVLILASGDKVRHMTVRPWMAALVTSVVGIFSVGYLAATTYLVLRDDLIGGTIARQARMQHEYEDRITALRAQVDRVTSRQLLDQQVVEEKVEKLLEQQSALWSRSDKFGALAASADTSEDLGEGTSPVIDPLALEKPADANGGVEAIEEIMGLNGEAGATPTRLGALAYAPASPESGEKETLSDRADRNFSKITLSLKDVERDQMARMEHLTSSATRTSEAIRTIVERTGVTLPAGSAEASASDADGSAIGGPFVEPQDEDSFGKSLVALDSALLELEKTRDAARKLPLQSPAPTIDVTSNFGNRLDPFLGRLALHAGIDFRTSIGTRIRSAAGGTVTTAGPTGGYGNMVEIDHGDGVVTRYAHLSVILVNVGDHVRAGDVIAKSGSTGRSTGPHLHYEVRLNGRAVDPVRFLRAGTKLAGLMD
ncbi:peptidoglycan DD-metalloendopeptidase family protein [Sinorhizobium terangae]|uniref:Peptidoglycan DD-metalloendopeptidase family protein n=1 Tax=Sinorhizobium terangae TaxID=110322 RepID=A0A6N7LH01_SINTE|nr:M23 family metallopeptidase [Sinorhizobium terangae]MQX17062.1 peptidoglycan DD-metalloendopeptidase family protein [Sinorhizobium terangae]